MCALKINRHGCAFCIILLILFIISAQGYIGEDNGVNDLPSKIRSSVRDASRDCKDQQCPGQTQVKVVHVVFMNHLDVGFDGIPVVGFVNNVLNTYFHKHFPKALNVSASLRAGGFAERLIYTTHPWLVSLYLDCPPDLWLAGIKLQCPTAEDVARFRKAVVIGDIAWHAAPMNLQYEYMDPSLITFGIRLSDDLDRSFNISRKYKTVSLRDVPGLTRAVIPTLVSAGVAAISVGVNTFSAPPAVPHDLFVWRHGSHDILATWNKGGYPVPPGPDPVHPGGLGKKHCVIVPGLDQALCYAFRDDNLGPPQSVDEVLHAFEVLRGEFPGADLKASTFESFMSAAVAVKETLPVFTQEVGDTWIQGDGTDPRKSAGFRTFTRTLAACLNTGRCRYDDQRIYNASRFLLKMGEHTWGLTSIGDNRNWSNADFQKARQDPVLGLYYRNATWSWEEQRNFSRLAMAALQDHPVAMEIQQNLKLLVPSRPQLDDFHQVEQPISPSFKCFGGSGSVAFNEDGSLRTLIYKNDSWASTASPLGSFVYITYNQTDYDLLARTYNWQWPNHDRVIPFYKINVTRYAHPSSQTWPVKMTELYQRNDKSCNFYAHIRLEEEESWQIYGAPRELWLQYAEHRQDTTTSLNVTLQWFDKTATRLPEALMLEFRPITRISHQWLLTKLDQLVDPTDVVLNGSQRQHALGDSGAYYIDPNSGSGLQVSSLDVPVVCPIINNQSTVFPYLEPLAQTDTLHGLSFNMFNNIWDTNYIFWYPYTQEDAAFKARFSISFVDKASRRASVLRQKLKSVKK